MLKKMTKTLMKFKCKMIILIIIQRVKIKTWNSNLMQMIIRDNYYQKIILCKKITIENPNLINNNNMIKSKKELKMKIYNSYNFNRILIMKKTMRIQKEEN